MTDLPPADALAELQRADCTTSLREIYYRTKHTLRDSSENTFDAQDESDPILEDLEVTLQVVIIIGQHIGGAMQQAADARVIRLEHGHELVADAVAGELAAAVGGILAPRNAALPQPAFDFPAVQIEERAQFAYEACVVMRNRLGASEARNKRVVGSTLDALAKKWFGGPQIGSDQIGPGAYATPTVTPKP